MSYILALWQILQNLAGLIYFPFAGVSFKEKIGDVFVFETKSTNGSVSLGNFVFISKYTIYYEKTLKHELGHTIQSKYLGPLYLLVIGLPSISWAAVRMMSKTLRKKDYYSFYTEAWAEELSKKFV
jgi:hypothetical protein